MTFEKTLKTELATLGLSPDDETVKKFCLYKDMLKEYNKKINLTADDSDEQILYKHFIDSLTLLEYMENDQKRCIDIGTGAGFPLIPVKLINEELEITLVDAVNKKVDFLEHLTGELGLKGVRCIHARAEDLAREAAHRGCYDLSVSRAVAKLRVLIEYSVPFLRNGGTMLAMKAEKGKEEVETADNALMRLNSRIESENAFDVSYCGEIYHRMIIKIRKLGEISDKYPRKAGIIKKDPL